MTPEDKPISKTEKDLTCRKTQKVSSVLSLPEQVSTDLTATVKKPILRVDGISPYS